MKLLDLSLTFWIADSSLLEPLSFLGLPGTMFPPGFPSASLTAPSLFTSQVYLFPCVHKVSMVDYFMSGLNCPPFWWELLFIHMIIMGTTILWPSPPNRDHWCREWHLTKVRLLRASP